MNIGGLFGGQWSSDPEKNAAMDQAANLFGAQMLAGAGSGQNFSSILGQAVGVGQGGYNDALNSSMRRKLMQAQVDEQRQMGDYRQAQIQDMQAKRTEEQRKVEEAQRQLQAQQEFFRRYTGGGAQPAGFRDANIAITGNAPPGYVPPQAQAPQQFQVSPAMLAEAQMLGIKPETLQKMAEAKNWGRDVMKQLVQTRDAQGRPTQMMVGEYGQQVGANLAPEYKPQVINQGDRQTIADMNATTPGQAFGMNMSPAERDAAARGWASNRLANERFAFDRGQAEKTAEQGKWLNDLQRGVQVNTATGEARPITSNGQPIGPKEDVPKEQREREAKDALVLIDQAEKLIGKATGSFIGAGMDATARLVGGTNEGAQAAAQLKALEGALIAKMPKMSGPQSDKDVLLYKQMAGQIGDSTLPADTKRAALQTIKEIQRRHAGLPMVPTASKNGTEVSGSITPAGATSIDDLVRKYGGNAR